MSMDAAHETLPRRAAGPPRTSRLSILALGLNVPCFIPPFPLAAAVLGVIAFRRVRRRDDLGGAALALAAVILGVSLAAVGGFYWYGFIRLTTHGPVDVIHAAERGDGRALRSHFAGDAALLTDVQIAEFASSLQQRYGRLRDGRIERSLSDPPRRGQVWSVPYTLDFERSSVAALADITTVDPRSGRSTLALLSITIVDADRGDLHLPARSRTLPPP